MIRKSDINSEVTHGNLGLERVLKGLVSGAGSAFENGITSGNVYYVIKADASFYGVFHERYQQTYEDGTVAVHADDGDGLGIQAALDACTANRDDYVLVMPSDSDYDLTVTLTMSKARTHLIAPSGLGKGGMSSNSVRLHQNTAATAMVTMSADTIECAGFFFKGGTGDIIIISGSRWFVDIHDNFFGQSNTDGTDNSGVLGAGAVNGSTIRNNYFTNYAPGLLTGTDNDMEGFINLSSASSGRNLIEDNIGVTGMNTEVTVGIQIMGTESIIRRNHIAESYTSGGGTQAGILTVGINMGATCFASDNNIFGTGASAALTGGTPDVTCISNWDSTNGRSIADTDT